MKDLVAHLRANGITHPVEPLEGDPSIFTLITPGNAAVPMWRKLRSLVHLTGYFPVILGNEDDAEEMLANAMEIDAAAPKETLEFAKTVDVMELIRKRREMDPEIFEEIDEGPWSPAAVEAPGDFAVPFDILTKRPHPAVVVALTPTRNPWEVPAYLRYGGWNDCPEAGIHAAFHKRWHDRYNAEIVCASHDIIEMTVGRPPKTKDEAMALAREQYMYCTDIVDQGVGTISSLGAILLNGKHWYFWWD